MSSIFHAEIPVWAGWRHVALRQLGPVGLVYVHVGVWDELESLVAFSDCFFSQHWNGRVGWREPGVVQGVLDVDSLHSVLLQKFYLKWSNNKSMSLTKNKVFGVLRNVLPDGVSVLNLVEDSLASYFLVVSWVEWQVARQHQVDYNTQRPYVYSFVVWLLAKNLGCNIAKGSKWLSTSFSRSKGLGKTEVH